VAAITTERLIEIALDLAGWSDLPPDSAVYYSGTRISHILLGIDIGSAELFMARQLGYHAVIAHRPSGYTGPVWQVYERHAAQMEKAGVPADRAWAAIAGQVELLQAGALIENYDRIPSVARLLEIPFLNVLSPLESVGRRLLASKVDEARGADTDITIEQLCDSLLSLPEFAGARPRPRLALGDWSMPAGTVAISHGAYLPPDASIARAYLENGVDTLICASFDGNDARMLQESGSITGAILTLGSVATANLGLNPYITRLRAEGIEVTPFSGVVGAG
jgi:hypothetical protein